MNVSECLYPADLLSWWGAAGKLLETNIPRYVSYTVVETDEKFVALLDKLSNETIVVYEILERSVLNRTHLKEILWEAAAITREANERGAIDKLSS